ncbi:MAG TPA: type I methionyl aminopeptidase [Alphaproteobacteria bacterium]|nr:type I methionyl aminopeptidase [Alphaproteobacteria bacterium]
MKLVPKNPVELKKMRAAGRLTAGVLDMIGDYVKPGVSTLELNDRCEEFMRRGGGIPATLGYKGYPKASCISVNDVVCHGIPSAGEILQDGDILNIDVTSIVDGFHGDSSRMYVAGKASPEAMKLISTTYNAMMAGIETVKSGSFLYEIGNAIEPLAAEQGYSVVREYCGHGLGKIFHEDPMVLHYANRDFPTNRLRTGLTFTVEPMINMGTWKTKLMDDGWTVRTLDGKLSAQFEHTIAVTEDGVEILTESLAGYTCPPYKS